MKNKIMLMISILTLVGVIEAKIYKSKDLKNNMTLYIGDILDFSDTQKGNEYEGFQFKVPYLDTSLFQSYWLEWEDISGARPVATGFIFSPSQLSKTYKSLTMTINNKTLTIKLKSYNPNASYQYKSADWLELLSNNIPITSLILPAQAQVDGKAIMQQKTISQSTYCSWGNGTMGKPCKHTIAFKKLNNKNFMQVNLKTQNY